MRVSTNVNSMVAQRYVKGHTEESSRLDSELSSGERIVHVADDPAGLAISEKMKSIIRSNSQAERNTNDSISLVQVAEGALNTIQDITSRLRELAVRSSSDTFSDMDRSLSDKEFQHLKNEVERIAKSTSYNGNQLLKGNDSVYDFQIGVNSDKNLDRIRYDIGKVMDANNNFGISGINLRSKESSQHSLTALNDMLSQISASRAELGSMGTRMNNIVQNLQVSRENISSSNSKIRDADYAKEAANKAKSKIAESASLAMLKIFNDQPGAILKLVGG